ncbi:Os02g0179400 [Oryza sativa Japonica Group]|uniref:Os02g0179400 protein n=1 Tax=Oryza sativa subsp. japonica TaxID=39947 RepID=A0A0P0VFG1_ORYSJ|nr:Os02g0179400 [Oryza sativa Japonica Group]
MAKSKEEKLQKGIKSIHPKKSNPQPRRRPLPRFKPKPTPLSRFKFKSSLQITTTNHKPNPHNLNKTNTQPLSLTHTELASSRASPPMAATKREPLRPISSNAGTVERRARGGAAAAAAAKEKEKENEVPTEIGRGKDGGEKKPPVVVAVVVPPAPPLKPSSLQVRMKAEEEKEREEEEEGSSPAVALVAGLQVRMGPRGRELLLPPPPPPPPLPLPTSSSYEAWDLSDNEAAPASSWATLPNRALLCRPLPLDVGRCTCIIAKETLAAAAAGARGVALYSLYTNEGQGRQDRKLAVARHRRRRGRSEFVVAQNLDGIFCTSDKNFLGTLSSNLVGSRYRIWGQGNRVDEIKSQSKRLLGVVAFAPTVTTLTGSFRSMRAWIPKNQSIHLKNSNSAQATHQWASKGLAREEDQG